MFYTNTGETREQGPDTVAAVVETETVSGSARALVLRHINCCVISLRPSAEASALSKLLKLDEACRTWKSNTYNKLLSRERESRNPLNCTTIKTNNATYVMSKKITSGNTPPKHMSEVSPVPFVTLCQN